jgi:biopolymer transport protein ExbD
LQRAGRARTIRPRPVLPDRRLLMRIASARRDDDFEINVISLIDVLLTLLMFFVLTTTFVQHSRMQVTLPQAESSEQSEQREALSVMIDRDGHYFIGNDEVLNPGLDSLKEAITRAAGADRDRPVMLRADAMTPHQAVVTAMDALGELGFTRLSIATTQAPTAAAK